MKLCGPMGESSLGITLLVLVPREEFPTYLASSWAGQYNKDSPRKQSSGFSIGRFVGTVESLYINMRK